MTKKIRLHCVNLSYPGIREFATPVNIQAYFRNIFLNMAPSLQNSGPQIVVLPEGVSLVMGSAGRFGVEARKATTLQEAREAIYRSCASSIAALHEAYPVATAYQLVPMALTNLIWRTMYSTFSELAKGYNTHIVYSGIFSRPLKITEKSYIPDPSDPLPKNYAVVFYPSGEYSLTAKVNLTHDETAGDIQPGKLEDVSAIELGGHLIGIATCFDAFHASYTKRLKDLGVDVLLVPSAISGWATYETPPYGKRWQAQVWQDDILGLTSLFKCVVCPVLRANLWDLHFDGQGGISTPSLTPPLQAFIGCNPSTSSSCQVEWMDQWAYPTPLTDPDHPTVRAYLQQLGDELKPGGNRSHSYNKTSWGHYDFS